MSHIVIGFSHHPDDWLSRVIKWLTHSNWTHMVLVEPGGKRFIEASGLSKPAGVKIRNIEDFVSQSAQMKYRLVPHPNPELVGEIACSFEGAGYDWWYWPAWFFRLPKLQDPNKFVCNELALDSAILAGHNPFPDDIERTFTTPRDWNLISKPLEE